MKTSFFSAAICSVFLFSHTVQAGSKTVILQNTEKYKNEVRFVSAAPLEKISGNAANITGSFAIDLQNLSATTGKFNVPVSSMGTGSSSRDKHMMAADWLDEAHFKNITYALKSLVVENTDNSTPGKTVITATAKGDFTLHGVTRPLDAKVVITYLNESAQTKQIAAGDLALVKVEFSVPLKAHGIAGKEGVVGSKVGESIAISAQLFGSTASH